MRSLSSSKKKEVGRWNLTLLDFGAITCTAKSPKCFECPLSKRCDWVRSNSKQKTRS